jgi:uncharacterized protein YbjT (DUF2867 family)
MSVRKILVTGATGKQGGAAIQALLDHPPPFDFRILALTRSTSSAKARKLASNRKVELISGDLSDCHAIFDSAGGKGSIWGVFSVTLPGMGKKEDGEDKETAQGKKLVDAAVANDVKHFVYTSVDRGGSKSDNNPTPIAHFISKHEVEQYLKEKSAKTDMSWTILRPVAFMDNLGPNQFGRLFATMWRGIGDKPLQLVATKDIGVFAAQALAFHDTDEYHNTAISLAGDELTQEQAKEVFWNTMGRPMPEAWWISGYLLQTLIKEVGTMFRWFKEVGYGADVQRCKKLHAGMMDLATYLKEESGFSR